MLKTIAATVVALVGFAGCATTAQIDAGIGNLVGQPTEVALRAWGYPDSSMPLGDNIVLIWGESWDVSMLVPQYTTASTYVNGNTYTTGVNSFMEQRVHLGCVRKLSANPKGIIVGYSWSGNDCGRYASR